MFASLCSTQKHLRAGGTDGSDPVINLFSSKIFTDIKILFSFRLLDRNKAMALDIPKFYRQARAQFAVRHKSSNQLLGYALLLPEVTVEDNEVRLIPWLDDDLLTDDAALAVHDKPQPAPSLTGLNSSSLSELNLNLSASSEASSQNTRLTSQSATDVTLVPVVQQPACRAGFNASLSPDKAPSSTSELIQSLSSSPSSVQSHGSLY